MKRSYFIATALLLYSAFGCDYKNPEFAPVAGDLSTALLLYSAFGCDYKNPEFALVVYT